MAGSDAVGAALGTRRSRAAAGVARWLASACLVACGGGGEGRSVDPARGDGADARAIPARDAAPVDAPADPTADVPAPGGADAGDAPDAGAGAGAAAACVDPERGSGTVYLFALATGHVIGSAGPARPGARVIEAAHAAAPEQRWILDHAGGSLLLRAGSAPELCLGRPAGEAALVPCADLAEASWRATPGDGAHRLEAPDRGTALRAAGRAGENVVIDNDTTRATAFELRAADLRARAIEPADCAAPRLDQLSFLVAHNAFHTSGEGGKLLPNQRQSIAAQLAAGVRGLQLDVYDHAGEVWTCHGACALPGLRGRPLREHLEVVARFAASDPTAIVTLFLEDYVASADALCRVVRETPGLGPLLFDPEREDVRTRGWPRRSAILARNQRVLLFSQRPGREACGIAHDRRFLSENHWSLGGATGAPNPACVTRWPDQPLGRCGEAPFRPLFVMNHYRDTPLACGADNGTLLRQRAVEICAQAAARKPNYVAVDCTDTGDAAAMVAELNRCER